MFRRFLQVLSPSREQLAVNGNVKKDDINLQLEEEQQSKDGDDDKSSQDEETSQDTDDVQTESVSEGDDDRSSKDEDTSRDADDVQTESVSEGDDDKQSVDSQEENAQEETTQRMTRSVAKVTEIPKKVVKNETAKKDTGDVVRSLYFSEPSILSRKTRSRLSRVSATVTPEASHVNNSFSRNLKRRSASRSVSPTKATRCQQESPPKKAKQSTEGDQNDTWDGNWRNSVAGPSTRRSPQNESGFTPNVKASNRHNRNTQANKSTKPTTKETSVYLQQIGLEESKQKSKERNDRQEYDEKEDAELVAAVVEMIKIFDKEDKQILFGGNVFWQRIQEKGRLPNRTWHSIRDHFSKSIMRKLADKTLGKNVMTKEDKKLLSSFKWILDKVQKYK